MASKLHFESEKIIKFCSLERLVMAACALHNYLVTNSDSQYLSLLPVLIDERSRNDNARVPARGSVGNMEGFTDAVGRYSA